MQWRCLVPGPRVLVPTAGGLSERELRRVLDVVAPEAVASEGVELPGQVLARLAALIPCAGIAFFEMDPLRRSLGLFNEINFAEFPAEDNDTQSLFFDAYWDCAACCRPEVVGPVTMWQDFHSEREYAALLMAEYVRSAGFWYELLVRLPPRDGVERRIMLVRQADDSPFSERDRLLLTLLQPHLAALRTRVEAQRRATPELTAPQVELLRGVARGDTNRQIARELGLTENTVRTHLEHIYARLDVHSRTEALARAATLLTG